MELKSMKLDASQAQEAAQPTALTDQPEYPYGLRLSLEKAALEKLGLSELPKVGTSMSLSAKVEVVAVSSEPRSVALQITDLALEGGEQEDSQDVLEQALYGQPASPLKQGGYDQ